MVLRQTHARFAMSAERQRAGEEKEPSPRQRGGQGAGSKSSPEVSPGGVFAVVVAGVVNGVF